LSAHQLSPLAHRDQADAAFVGTLGESRTMIFHFEFERFGQESQTHPGCLGARMSRYVIQCFRHDAVNVNSGASIYRKRSTLLFIGYGNTGWPFHARNAPVQLALESSFVE